MDRLVLEQVVVATLLRCLVEAVVDLGDLLPVGVLAELAEVDLLVALLAGPVEAAFLEQEERHR